MELIKKYFPSVTSHQLQQFTLLSNALVDWNEKINVVSRKDINQLEERHILHSLAIAKFISFLPGTKIIDVGTGGGFPGLPLAIMFPESEFTLVDSIAKKIFVLHEISTAANIQNIKAFQSRAENIKEQFEFVVSRAVTAFPQFYRWTCSLVTDIPQRNTIPNGIISLKGGQLNQELAGFGKRIQTTSISNWFEEPWFEEKKVVFLKI
ncbi:MAG: 16S rRNA (guanine(527)-N(7))-methyltransferase RsmG [Bacteroidales bacterium]|nr:16S rRNA (guanine(527)-N(7))-methyltransferase RsmG [Bacteroidales bacterium]